MRTQVLAWSLLALTVAGCLEPAPRSALEVQLRGPAYPRPRCAKGSLDLGPVHSLGDPVAGAEVTLTPGNFVARTDENGRALFKDLPEDSYRVQVNASGFAPRESKVALPRNRTTSLPLSLLPCVNGGGHRLRVGFDSAVTLEARTLCTGPEWSGASFRWTQLEGPDVRDSVRGWDQPQLTLRTRKLEDVRPLPDEPQLLSFSPDQAGEYVFQVTARTASGATARDYVFVTSTNVTTGVTSVPAYDTYYFVGEKTGPWQWVIAEWPSGWAPTLSGENTRTPSVRAVPTGTMEVQQRIILRNERTLLTFSLVVGRWNQVNRDCGRGGCHPSLQQSWEQTRHGTTWRRLVDGEISSPRGPLAPSCAACHAMGYDPSVPNDGYDDVAEVQGATLPTTPQPGTYARLPEAVKEVSNVHCLACHGPARVDPPMAEQPGRFSVGVCARCHDRLPEQDLVHQWRQSRMSRSATADVNGPAARKECSRCHTAQGFYYQNVALGRPPSEDVVVMTCCDQPAPITCQTCHSPMFAYNQAQVFRSGSLSTRSGLQLKDIGSGALCAMCHSTDHDTAQASTLAERLGPHSPQTELTYGRGGFVLPAPGLPAPGGAGCARTAGEGCVTCHMDKGPPVGQPGHRAVGDHTFRMTSLAGVANTRPCQACHEGRATFDPRARGDYDGDGTTEGVRAEVDGLMALIRARLGALIDARGYVGCDPQRSRGVFVRVGHRTKIVVVDQQGYDLGDCDRNGRIDRQQRPFLFPDADLTLHQAAYNYLFVAADRSRGLHNVPYVVKLLQRTIAALSAGQGLPRWELYQ